MSLPTNTVDPDRLLKLVEIYNTAAIGKYPPNGGLCSGALLNKWWRTNDYDPGKIYLISRGVVSEFVEV